MSQIHTHIDAAKRRGTVVMSGSINALVAMQAAEALYDEPQWQPGFDLVWDCRGMTELLLERSDLATMTAHIAAQLPRSGDGRRALVVTRDLDHMVSALIVARTQRDGRTRRVFRTLEAALAWLDEAA